MCQLNWHINWHNLCANLLAHKLCQCYSQPKYNKEMSKLYYNVYNEFKKPAKNSTSKKL